MSWMIVHAMANLCRKVIPTGAEANSVHDILLNQLQPRLPASGTLATSAEVSSAEANIRGTDDDTLKGLSDQIDKIGFPLSYRGRCAASMTASTTSIVCPDLAGYGNGYFSDKYYVGVVLNANNAGASPERYIRQVTNYASATGTFTTVAFPANIEANDEIQILHDSLPFTKYAKLTSGSGNWTVPPGRDFVDVLVVAGGGGGGTGDDVGRFGGGGGGGEIVWWEDYEVAGSNTISYVVGAGGVGQAWYMGTNGASSSFGNIVAAGGLAGGRGTLANNNSGAGGSGGSSAYATTTTTEGGTGGAEGGSPSKGLAGTCKGGGKVFRHGGGGGGAGQYTSGVTTLIGGATIFACNAPTTAAPCGGSGGNSWGAGAAPAASAAANSGGGGGGGGNGVAGGNGGSGYILVIWR